MKNIKFLLLIGLLTNCVQERHLKTIHFKVDMRNQINFNRVGIRGDFKESQWQKTIPMTDRNNDSIYEVTISQKTAKNGFEFKYIKNDSVFELSNQGNRSISFDYESETISIESIFNQSSSIITKN
ncbi:MAG: hypothetical protein AAF688_08225 [Bacteroidota bacterium]